MKLLGGTGKDWWAFERIDRWGFVSLFAWVALGAAWAGVVGPVMAWIKDEPIQVEIFSSVKVPELDKVGVLYREASYRAELPDPSAAQRLVSMMPGMIGAVLVVVACWLVIRIMGTISAGDPFARANVKRLPGLGVLLVLGSGVLFFSEVSVGLGLLGSTGLGALGLGFEASYPWIPSVAGMVALLMAEAFRAGARLREDVEGLI